MPLSLPTAAPALCSTRSQWESNQVGGLLDPPQQCRAVDLDRTGRAGCPNCPAPRSARPARAERRTLAVRRRTASGRSSPPWAQLRCSGSSWWPCCGCGRTFRATPGPTPVRLRELLGRPATSADVTERLRRCAGRGGHRGGCRWAASSRASAACRSPPSRLPAARSRSRRPCPDTLGRAVGGLPRWGPSVPER